MCYSAMVKQDLKKLGIQFHARIQTDLFDDIFKRRAGGEKLSLPRGMELNFLAPKTIQERMIKNSIEKFETLQLSKTNEELEAQNKRLKVAIKKLSEKTTKGAEKEKAVSERQILRLESRIKRLSSKRTFEKDSRIYAFDWAPVVTELKGERVIVPMRYFLRPFGMQPDFDRKYPGCYNARKDSLTGFWKRQFGKNHGLIVISSFFENVKKHDYEKRKLKKGEEEENMVLQFKPEGMDEMIVPCIWDHWSSKEDGEMDGFALITDDPPKEIAETGHNRCPVFLKEEKVEAWLNPMGKSEQELFKILEDRQKPYYNHEIAA